jgi:hypothetical protein
MEWAAWRWENVKMDKESLSIMRQSVNISKDDMKDYNLAMFKCNGLLQRRCEFKEVDSRAFFHKLFE